jgi:hypothetical protein
VEYLLGAPSGGESGGVVGRGLSMVGVVEGSPACAAAVRAMFGQLRHPDSTAGSPVFLGRRPRRFRPLAERIAAAVAAEPDAGEEWVAAIGAALRADPWARPSEFETSVFRTFPWSHLEHQRPDRPFSAILFMVEPRNCDRSVFCRRLPPGLCRLDLRAHSNGALQTSSLQVPRAHDPPLPSRIHSFVPSWAEWVDPRRCGDQGQVTRTCSVIQSTPDM